MIAGIGINDSTYETHTIVDGQRIFCPYYLTWISMIYRCYGKTAPLSYKDCTVCDEWLLFSNFRQWMTNQPWKGKHLDKDVRIIGNKIYSPGTCLFVSRDVNNLVKDCPSRRGEWPLGVYKTRGKFRAMMRVRGKTVHLGRFDNPSSASKAYRTAKYNHIVEIALLETEPTKSALLRHASCYA